MSNKDRNGLAGLLPLGKDQWLTVGEGGIRVQQKSAAKGSAP